MSSSNSNQTIKHAATQLRRAAEILEAAGPVIKLLDRLEPEAAPQPASGPAVATPRAYGGGSARPAKAATCKPAACDGSDKPPQCRRRKGAKQEAVLAAIEANPGANADTIARIAGCARSTAAGIIAGLKKSAADA